MPTDHYIFSNAVVLNTGETIGKFSSHGAAVCASIRLNDPTYAPLSGWSQGDLKEFEEMKNRIEARAK